MRKCIIRNDDFDGRMPLVLVESVHDMFVRQGLKETICINCFRGSDVGMQPEVQKYVRERGGEYVLAVHGFEHDDMLTKSYKELIMDFAASAYFIYRWFGRFPTHYAGPWNQCNEKIKKACEATGLEVIETGVEIKAYVREYPRFKDAPSVYFHMWDRDVMLILEDLLIKIKEYGDLL